LLPRANAACMSAVRESGLCVVIAKFPYRLLPGRHAVSIPSGNQEVVDLPTHLH
jgi:hypothetical protein